jgi:serine/threonine protein kinase/tetratricopeptide (TPR) repeat protein
MSETPLRTLGKYEIRRELGKGAMGVVYLGFDPGLEREVALKVMASAIVSDSELKDRFEKEAKSVAKLQHPNIVTVYDLGYDEQGAPFIAMEYLKGDDLEKRIRRDPLTFREKLDVVAQTCRGLAHAHKNGIVHRDVKPANIFISDSGDAKIMDFGVARWKDASHTQTGAVLGTADYMSPEQIRGQKDLDGRSDVFSVGVILYRLLTNKKPFAGENIQAVFFKILNQEAPELVLPEGSEMPELQAIVDKALSKTVEERYATADDLADDIKDLMNLYRDTLNEDTVFETMFDPAAVPEDAGSDGSGRRRTSSTGRVLGTSGSSGGGISRTHRPGTAFPSTATGRTASGRTVSQRTVAGRTVVAPTRMMARSQGASVGIPVDESGGAWKYVAAVALLLAVGAVVFWFTQLRNRPDVNAGTNVVQNTTPAPPTIAERLAKVQSALDQGYLTAASNDVEQILLTDPQNAEALALKTQIEQAQRQATQTQASQTTPNQTIPPPTTPTQPKGPSKSEEASQLAVQASVAMGNGRLDEADGFVQKGRQLDPANPVWQQLAQQIERVRKDAAQAEVVRERQAVIDRYVSQAAEHVRNRDYEGAIAAYDKALEQDPTNVQLLTGKNNVMVAMEQQKAAASVRALQISETATEYVAPGAGNEGPKGFDTGGVQVHQATKAPDNPGELVVQIQPETVQPGDPYVLRVRVHNQGNKPIGVKAIELVSTYGAKTIGKGQQLTPLVQRVNPRDTSVIWETRGTWSEDQNHGSIEAIVTLIGDAKLRKTIQWQ